MLKEFSCSPPVKACTNYRKRSHRWTICDTVLSSTENQINNSVLKNSITNLTAELYFILWRQYKSTKFFKLNWNERSLQLSASSLQGNKFLDAAQVFTHEFTWPNFYQVGGRTVEDTRLFLECKQKPDQAPKSKALFPKILALVEQKKL